MNPATRKKASARTRERYLSILKDRLRRSGPTDLNRRRHLFRVPEVRILVGSDVGEIVAD